MKWDGDLMKSLTQAVNRQVGGLLDAEARDAAKRDPLGNKASRKFEVLRWRYYDAGKNGKGQTIRFGWSTTKNIAGFFLTWREVRYVNGEGRRDMFSARRKRKAVKDLAHRRYLAFLKARE